ncbi:MAG: metallo-mystery pair system four-Cys motif protein [Agitococcus sp.]|nr:metallo-mystery pair system four-Cys motif protein [Agitococcus sp.]
MRSLLTSSLVAASAVLLTACGSDDSPATQVATTQAVSIQFAAQANGKDAQCGAVNEITNLGTSKKTAEIQDLRFYVSELKLINDKGLMVDVALDKNANQDFGVALLDFENATGACSADTGSAKLYTAIMGNVPTGTYTGVQFTLGVPDTWVDSSGKTITLSHSNTTAITAPLDVPSMAWSWQGGRKFAKIEFKPTGGVTNQKGTPETTDDATVSSWVVHMGATGCTGSETTGYSCTNPNLAKIAFSGFDVSKQKIVLDVPALVAQSDISVNQNSALGCMSGSTDKECPAVFDTLGLDLPTGKVSTSKTQTVFKVINK